MSRPRKRYITSAVKLLADDYRNILLGDAHTVTFTAPSLSTMKSGADLEQGTVAASMCNDFG